MNFEGFAPPQENPKPKPKLGVEGIALMGALALSPNAVAAEDASPSVETQPTISQPENGADLVPAESGQKISFADYLKGTRTNDNPDEAHDHLREMARQTGDLRMPAEQVLDARTAALREKLAVDETLDIVRKRLNDALDQVTEATGTSANWKVQMIGNAIVTGAVGLLDHHISGKLNGVFVGQLSPEDRSVSQFVADRRNADGMLLKKTLGNEKKDWQVTFGADPFHGSVGVTFRMQMP